MRRVVVESPWRGDVAVNRTYAVFCLRDCLKRNESPICSHLLFAANDVLNDARNGDRQLGIHAGHVWTEVADALVVYTDRGISEGMKAGIAAARLRKIRVEYRTLNGAKGHG